MTTLVDEPARETAASPAQRLRATMAAVRVGLKWLGVRKTLTPEQKAQAADTFGAEGQFLSAGKKLLDTKHPAFKAVTAVGGRIRSYWRSLTLPFPEPGVRLIRQNDIGAFNKQLETFKSDLAEAVWHLDEHYSELRSAARERLGSLYNEGDYPNSLRTLFDVMWDFPSVEPPNYLRELSPEIYEAERARVSARFDEAVRLTEEAFLSELAKLVSHLTERITGQEDGKAKVFRDSAVTNLSEFFERFKSFNVRSSAELDQLVERAQQAVRGVDPQNLRDNGSVRRQLATELASVQSTLDGLMVDRPRRNILRRPK